ncbi:MAG: hypothetical protein AMQ22_02314 [Candidatus Methanofastidiosum methylothiophilum]|uniref:Uncharacterized protein n=1 Tax=Candidatus Methanofastidiosum methylothiophilum TaxID=1705564 RepID=A0A150IH75_9EURY|nr:MAG: hypothetical protein AMQ22_02314 [Candidatus Methanofastidiosum methylthiophilus]
MSEPFGQRIDLDLYVFGYRGDKEFSEMPKINVEVNLKGYSIYDQKKSISNIGIEVNKTPTEITVKVPIKDLGDPEKVIFSATTSTGLLSLDSMPWRIVILNKE